MPLTREQRSTIRTAKQRIRRRGASPREAKALVEALGVESNYRNLPYGDRDSEGVLQQRPGKGWGPASESAATDIDQFLEQAARINRAGFKGSAGKLAQAVQRSAYPGRYDQRSAEAAKILAGAGVGGAGGRRGGSRTEVTFTPGVDRSDIRQQAKLAYLDQRDNPDALLTLKQTLDASQDTPGRTTTRTLRANSVSAPARASKVDDIKAEAALINSAKVPYKWGGGHQGRQLRGSKVTPLDCSGAVSRVLGINPRVSGQFEGWGQAGKGKRVTIYANGEHVLMEIDGHFWGTSQSNPGGGAGWIPRSKLSRQYLSRFVARHPQGM